MGYFNLLPTILLVIFIGQGISARLPKFIPDPDDFPVSQFQIPYSQLFWLALKLANWSKNVIGEF